MDGLGGEGESGWVGLGWMWEKAKYERLLSWW